MNSIEDKKRLVQMCLNEIDLLGESFRIFKKQKEFEIKSDEDLFNSQINKRLKQMEILQNEIKQTEEKNG